MKKQVKSFNKRFITMSLVLLIIFGSLPIQPIAELFGTSITASADVVTSYSVGSIIPAGSTIHCNYTSKINGSTYAMGANVSVSSRSKVTQSNWDSASSYWILNYGTSLITPSVTAPKGRSLTYNGSAQTLINAGSTTGGTMQYSLNGSSWSTSLPTGTNPGPYTVYYRVVGNNTYSSVGAKTITVTINKATPSVTPPTAINLTYNGSAQTLINGGSTTGGTMQYSLDGSKWSTTLPTGKNAGDYTVYYRVVGNTYYNDVAANRLTVTIAKANPKVTAPEGRNLTYSGSDQTLITAGSTTGGTMQYSLDGTNYSTSLPAKTNVGNYLIFYKVVGDANYNDVAAKTVNSTIVRATAEVTPPAGKTLTYDGSAQTLITAGSTTGGTMQYSLDGENYSTELPKGTKAGDYTIYYKVVGGDSYNDVAPQTVKSTIEKATPKVTAPNAKELVYNSEAQELVTPGTTTGGTMQYSLDGENWSDEIPTAVNVGVYPVYYKVVGDSNYNGVDPERVTSTILRVPNIAVKKDITVLNIDKNDTPNVTAYQIIKGTYRDGKLTGYVLCDGLGTLTIADMEKPTEDEVTAIAAAIRANEITLDSIPMTRSAESESSDTVYYTADAEPGLYIVLVTDSNLGYVYNPAVVAVNVKDPANVADSIVGGAVDMTTYFDYPPEAYIKSSKISLEKSIIDSNGNKTKGTSAAYGETVNFRIDNMTIPSYSNEYINPKFIISDTLEASAFDGIKGLIIKVDGTAIAPGSGTFTLTGKDKDGNDVSTYDLDSSNNSIIMNAVSFTIDFAESFLEENEGKSVVIDYSSLISDTAGYNYAENQNVAKIVFSDNPGSTTEITDKTYHYTFGISAKIDGEDESKKIITNEINKVSEDSNETKTVTNSEGYIITKNEKALADAQFTLYNNFNLMDTDIVAVTVSDENGLVSFTGLKAGTYYLAETAAPKGYTIKATIYRVEIIPVFDDIGVMTSYTINTYVAGENGERGEAVQTASYTNTGYKVNDDGSVTNNITIDENLINPLDIINTTLANLPSTGGMGTIIITIGASLGMAAFLAMFIVNKRKKEN